MSLQVLTPALVHRAQELTQNEPPQSIQDLVQDIEGDKRVLILRAAVTGQVDQDLARSIACKAIRLEEAYGAWLQGEM